MSGVITIRLFTLPHRLWYSIWMIPGSLQMYTIHLHISWSIHRCLLYLIEPFEGGPITLQCTCSKRVKARVRGPSIIKVIIVHTFITCPSMPSPPAVNGDDMQTSPPKSKSIFSLENILGSNHESIEHPGPGSNGAPVTGWDEEAPETAAAEGFCIECEGVSPSPAAGRKRLTNLLNSGQTSLPRSSARHAQMYTVKYASLLNIEKALARPIQSNHLRRNRAAAARQPRKAMETR